MNSASINMPLGLNSEKQPIISGLPFKYLELRKDTIRQRSDSCIIVLIFGVVAYYACIHLQNEGCTSVNMVDDFRLGTNGLTLYWRGEGVSECKAY